MTVPFSLVGNFDIEPHHFRIYEAINSASDDWLESLAEEYVRILSHTETSLRTIRGSEDTGMDMSLVNRYVRKASIPKYEEGNFGVVRSDFGELICYMLLERDYGTKFGVKSIYERELRDRPGRGIDAIGIEERDLLTLVLCEVKVSDDQSSPPGVVDHGSDCLSKQHQYHLENLNEKTKNKVWRTVQKTRDSKIATLLTAAALCLEENKLDRLHIIVCNVLARPKAMHRQSDFGSFKRDPARYNPAAIRFLIACIPDDVNVIISKWYGLVQKKTEVSV